MSKQDKQSKQPGPSRPWIPRNRTQLTPAPDGDRIPEITCLDFEAPTIDWEKTDRANQAIDWDRIDREAWEFLAKWKPELI
jgi:hypothetical protein